MIYCAVCDSMSWAYQEKVAVHKQTLFTTHPSSEFRSLGYCFCPCVEYAFCEYAFWWSAIPTFCYILMCFFLFMSLCSSRCMLELKFAIYHRAENVFTGFLSRCRQYWLKNNWANQTLFCTPTVFLIQQSCVLYFVAVFCVHAYMWRKNSVTKEAIVLQWAVWTTSWDFKPIKKGWAGALLSGKCWKKSARGRGITAKCLFYFTSQKSSIKSSTLSLTNAAVLCENHHVISVASWLLTPL